LIGHSGWVSLGTTAFESTSDTAIQAAPNTDGWIAREDMTLIVSVWLRSRVRRSTGGKLNGPLGKIVNVADCTDIMRNVLQQDLAELLSNPRLLPAWNARRDYLSTIGHWSDNKNETGRVWTRN
jgi:hypothetical protein